jgi:tRNA G18 (ribose-2'-O)-methylase SpoU
MAEKSRLPQPNQGATDYVLVLHDIRSVYNVGALFRTADAVGINRIIVSGFTPAPVDRFGRLRPDIAKAALGAEQSVPWETAHDCIALLKTYRDRGYAIVGLEQVDQSVDYKDVVRSEQMVFVLGTETTGMSTEMVGACTVIAEIPMLGMKESLNVSVAAGILLYRVLDQ